ncbi:hypothetical protein FQR65_LT15028 [Abscondita terminalis]|nr:hypothetical protein FQR65_LT15028 [Abscondita terminalis]
MQRMSQQANLSKPITEFYEILKSQPTDFVTDSQPVGQSTSEKEKSLVVEIRDSPTTPGEVVSEVPTTSISKCQSSSFVEKNVSLLRHWDVDIKKVLRLSHRHFPTAAQGRRTQQLR